MENVKSYKRWRWVLWAIVPAILAQWLLITFSAASVESAVYMSLDIMVLLRALVGLARKQEDRSWIVYVSLLALSVPFVSLLRFLAAWLSI